MNDEPGLKRQKYEHENTFLRFRLRGPMLRLGDRAAGQDRGGY